MDVQNCKIIDGVQFGIWASVGSTGNSLKKISHYIIVHVQNCQLISQLSESKNYKGIAVSNAASIKLEKTKLYKNEWDGSFENTKKDVLCE